MSLFKKILKALKPTKGPTVVPSGLYYDKKHPETQTDAKLIWTGLKHHLSKPENFDAMVRRSRQFKGHHSININHLPISQKLKDKYAGKFDGIHFVHDPEDSASVNFDRSKGGVNYAALNFHRIRGLGIHPEEILHDKNGNKFRDPKTIDHGLFMKSLRGKFDTFVHEFTHLHDHVIKGRKIDTPAPDTPSGKAQYYNSWPEVHARKNQLAYKMDKVLSSNPTIVHQLKGKPLTGAHMARVGEIAKNNPFSHSNMTSWDLGNDKTRRTYSKIFRQVAAKHGLKLKHE